MYCEIYENHETKLFIKFIFNYFYIMLNFLIRLLSLFSNYMILDLEQKLRLPAELLDGLLAQQQKLTHWVAYKFSLHRWAWIGCEISIPDLGSSIKE